MFVEVQVRTPAVPSLSAHGPSVAPRPSPWHFKSTVGAITLKSTKLLCGVFVASALVQVIVYLIGVLVIFPVETPVVGFDELLPQYLDL